jgi:Toxin co-regulated pilus biosynthesis protein Q
MIKNKITIAILSVFFVGTALHSSEAFSQTHSRSNVLSDTRGTEGVLTQIGSPSGVMEPLKGFAKDLPLVAVMRQITPNGWIVKKSDNDNNKLNTEMLVSWQGGSNWVETLGTLVKSYPVNASVNWDRKEITLMAIENKVVAKTMIFELEKNNVTKDIASGASEQVKEVIAPVAPIPVPVASWTLDSKLSLKENVTAWANKSGYRVVWLGEDYPLDDSRVLSGNFDKEDGPIKQLASDYGPKSRVQHPLSFQFFQNSTLVVENWKFEQIGYPQFGSKE